MVDKVMDLGIINISKSRLLVNEYWLGEKMKNFAGFASNGEYSVGCTGQTVYLYNKEGKEIARFKDWDMLILL